jgi:hypothetical protein
VSDLEAYRAELVGWLEANLDQEVIAAGHQPLEEGDNFAILRAWNARLADAGWASPSWPARWGGRDAGIAEQLAWFEEMTRRQAPGVINVIGCANIAPAIMTFADESTQERHLRPMLRGDEIWSQGMSEPDAGSDLASLSTRAERQGDVFIVNGQKIWNSLGSYADFCQLYVRTDPEAPKHKGISCLLVDMSSPGIEVRALRTMAGDHQFAEVFFADVEVPANQLLGELNQGWSVAMTTLSYERAGVARFHLMLSDRLGRLIEEATRTGRRELRDPLIRDRIAQLHIEIASMRFMTTRELEAVGAGRQPSAAVGSAAKLMWARASQDLAVLAIDVLGLGALDSPWGRDLLGSPSSSIAGGTTNINKNILAEQSLGLPR